MIQYRQTNEGTISDVVRDVQAQYGTQTAITLPPPSYQFSIGQKAARGISVMEFVNTAAIVALYREISKDLETKVAEWQRVGQDWWERLEMEMGAERDVVFKQPKRPKRRIEAILHYRGRQKPKFYYEPVEEE